jgi:hypothetical protein
MAGQLKSGSYTRPRRRVAHTAFLGTTWPTATTVDGTVTATPAASTTLPQAPVITGATVVTGGAPAAAATTVQATGGTISATINL